VTKTRDKYGVDLDSCAQRVRKNVAACDADSIVSEAVYSCSLRGIESVVLDFVPSYLTVRLIQNFYINIIYFIMTYFIIKDTLIII
jgi:hypothetical protein